MNKLSTLKVSASVFYMLAAPLLLIAAVWWNARRELPARPPADWQSGLPRVAVNGWRVVPVQPADVARGLTASVECDLWRLGSLPIPPASGRSEVRASAEHAVPYLVFRRGSHWQRLLLPDGTGGVRIRPIEPDAPEAADRRAEFPTKQHTRVQLLLPFGLLPTDAKDVQLRGKIAVFWFENGRKQAFPAALKASGNGDAAAWRFHAESAPLLVKLAALPRWDAQPGIIAKTSASIVRVLKADVQNVARQDYENIQPGDAFVDLHLQVPQPFFSRNWRNKKWPRIIESRVTDAKGHVFLPRRGELTGISPNCLSGIGMSSGGGLPKDEFKARDTLPLWSIPATAGPLTLTMWVATDDNEWPIIIKREARPAWLMRRARTIKIEAVKFSKVRGVVAFKDGSDVRRTKHVVDVTLLYTGPKIPIARGYMKQLFSGDATWTPYDFYREPLYRLSPDSELVKPGPKHAELIFDWSQRLTDVRGQFHPADAPSNTDAVTMIDVEEPKQTQGWHRVRGAWRWKVRYFIRSWPKAKKPLWFRADIGVTGEGLVPVSCPVDLR
jgi:hypothetical protein